MSGATWVPSARGGARNDGRKVTDSISRAQAILLLEACRRAYAAGQEFNRFTTVHWERAGLADGRAATSVYLDQMRREVRRLGGVPSFVWVRENGVDKGNHLHLIWHKPEALNLRSCSRKWARAAGADVKANVTKSRTIGVNGLGRGPSYLANLCEAMDYILKGTESEARQELGIARAESGGLVTGKRCGHSQSLAGSKIELLRGDATAEAFDHRCEAFDEAWRGKVAWHLGGCSLYLDQGANG